MKPAREPVLILGAGIQGVSAALALAHQGHRVTLVDSAPEPMLGASNRNEGKIHLGLVYARDESFRTAELMMDAAMRFGPLIDRWLGRPVDWRSLSSQPFRYVIARDSMVPAPDLHAFYERLQRRYSVWLEDAAAHYLGARSDRLWEEAAACPGVDERFSTESVTTCEVALDVPRFRRVLLDRLLETEGVTLLCGHAVAGLTRTSTGFRVDGVRSDGDLWSLDAPVVANCTWASRLALDAQLGIVPSRSWVYRLKCGLLGDLPPALADVPSITFVLGPYGDVVRYPTGPSYFSWYPSGMKGWSTDQRPPREWDEYSRGPMRPSVRAELVESTLVELGRIIAGFEETSVQEVKGCVIFSWGATDIDDYYSELHERHEIGVMAYDGYFSVDPGKFTCGPYFGNRLAELLS